MDLEFHVGKLYFVYATKIYKKKLMALMVNISYLDNLKRFHKFLFPDKDRKQNKTKTYAGLFFPNLFKHFCLESFFFFFSALESHILSEIHLRFLANWHFTYWWDDSWYLRKVRRGTDKDWAMPDRKTLMESEKAGEEAQTQAVRRGRCAEALAAGSSECSDKDTGY